MSRNEGLYCESCTERLFSNETETDAFFSEDSACTSCGCTTAGKDVKYCARCGIMDVVCCGCGKSREQELERRSREKARKDRARMKIFRRNTDRLPASGSGPIRREAASESAHETETPPNRQEKKSTSRKKSRDAKLVRRPHNHFCWTSNSRGGYRA